MLRLHHAPLACSLASRLALHESGLAHEIVFADTKAEAYRRINPRGQVPALETDEGVLTESSAILPYIADLARGARLFPADGFARAAAQAWLGFLSSTLHVALARVMFPPPGCDNDAAQAAALAKAVAAYQDLEAHLAGRDHILDAFSVCDLLATVFGLWRAHPALGANVPPLPHLDRLQQNILARPGVGAILGEEMQQRAKA